MAARARLWLAAAALCAARAPAQERDNYADLNLNPASDAVAARCTRADGREGICLPYTQCTENFSIAFGGDLTNFEIRDGSPPVTSCGGKFIWCCTDDSKMLPPEQREPTAAMCSRAGDDCPWCVALYRSGGDVPRGHRAPSGLYCAGALLGARVVLTAATCVVTAGAEEVWARVPAAADPGRRHTVEHRLKHERYNSGSHANDFGLLTLRENVGLRAHTAPACVSLAPPLQDGCWVVGFDDSERMVVSPLAVRDGDCPPRARTIPDMACGSGAACNVALGAPVLCPPPAGTQGGRAVAGVVRRRCEEGAALLGKLQPHAEWLARQLERLGVHRSQYDG